MVYGRIRQIALQIASYVSLPEFYTDFPEENDLSRNILDTDPVVIDVKNYVMDHLENDFGHGMIHAVKVALDAGALMAIEGRRNGYDSETLIRRIRVSICAGLLHDIKRKEPDHASRGADHAREVLASRPFSISEREDIALAIQNHEAFKTVSPLDTPEGRLVSDCLYDADKFRWGPDNFTDTVWDMVIFLKLPLKEFMERYPKGLEMLERIKGTFRTSSGRRYGPQFISLGIAIGQELYLKIREEFPMDCMI